MTGSSPRATAMATAFSNSVRVRYGPGPLSGHQARRQGQILHGQFARSMTRRASSRRAARSTARMSASTASPASTARCCGESRGDVLGRPEAQRYRERAARLKGSIAAHFWDDRRKIFANRLWSGEFVKSLAPTSFYPLLCDAVDAGQRRHLLSHLEDEHAFGGSIGLPSVSRADPAFADNTYWRGRVWPILNWLVWLGLHIRAGKHGCRRRGWPRGTRPVLGFLRESRRSVRRAAMPRAARRALTNPMPTRSMHQARCCPIWRLPKWWIVSPFEGWTLTDARVRQRQASPVLMPGGPVSVEREGGC